MKKQIIWFVIAIVSFLSGLVIPYLEGRSNSWWTIPPMLPADLVPLLLLFISCAVLFSFWIRSIVAKNSIVLVGSMFFVALLLFIASFAVKPANLFLRGFRDYAKNVLTDNEWRAISRFAQEHLQPKEKLPGPLKNLWDEKQHRALWSELTAATQIQKLDPSLVIYVGPESTEITWGGALVGHRAVVISSGKSDTNKQSRSFRTMSIAEDIAVSISAD